MYNSMKSELRMTNSVEMKAKAARLKAASRVIPSGQVTSVICAFVIYLIFLPIDEHGFLLPWLIAIVTVAIGWIVTCIHEYRKQGFSENPKFHIHMIYAGLSSGLFGIGCVYIYPVTTGLSSVFIGAFVFSMISIGSLILSTLPKVAGIWILGLGLAIYYILTRDGSFQAGLMSIVLTCFLGYMMYTVLQFSNIFYERFLSQTKVEEQKDVISLLLRDFEENAGDWLWETDVKGNLSYVSSRMIPAFKRLTTHTEGVNLVEVIQNTYPDLQVEGADNLKKLSSCLAQPIPFREIMIPVWIDDKPTWWELTGKPQFSEHNKLTGWRGVGRDITERKQYQNEIEYRANHDVLTGIANRYCLRRTLDNYFSEQKPITDPCALVLLDIDNFKTINAIFGNSTGDKILQEIADRLKKFANIQNALAARMGGDRFALFLMTPSDDIVNIVQALSSSLNQPISIDNEGLTTCIRAGYSYISANSDDTNIYDANTLLHCAELALSATKNTTTDTIRGFDGELAKQSRRHFSIISELGKALDRGEFRLHYQPQVDVVTGEFVGAEALIRWENQKLGQVSPAEFIPLAETNRHIVTIGDWIIEQACRDATQWPQDWKVAVNISAAQFMSNNFAKGIMRALAISGLSPKRLKLEITESLLLGDGKHVIESLNYFKTQDIVIALDDFGTGYSSLSYLRNFPLDELKIDQSFVRSMENKLDSVAIIETIIRLAHTLNLTTTAEGVETNSQASVLRSLGCTTYQGYLYGKPVSQAEIMAYQDKHSFFFAPKQLEFYH